MDRGCESGPASDGLTIESASAQDGLFYYQAKATPPANGNWVGFFFEVQYPGPGPSDYRLTTQVSIVPRTYPFPPCGTGAACEGPLV
jgi:hypothetical protein